MASMSLRVRYRPVRIGWCVESGQWQQLRTALRLTHAFAGGRFNPLIPVDSPALAESLLDRFRIDLLYPVAETQGLQDFIKMHNYLRWPEFKPTLFHERWEHIPPHAAFVDVYHAARRLQELKVRKRKALLVTHDDDDPLAIVILATAGGYPTPSNTTPDYEEMLRYFLGVDKIVVHRDEPLPAMLQTRITPSRLTADDLEPDGPSPDHGVYVGDSENFDDLVNFWNLRAAGSGVVFFDPRHTKRFGELLENHKRWLASVPSRPWQEGGRITAYGRDIREEPDLSAIGERVIRHSLSVDSWNGLNIKPALRHWKEHSILGSVDESDRAPSVTFSLPDKPVYDVPGFTRQHLAVTISGSDLWNHAHHSTFFPPYLPDLNEYYARQMFYHYARVRTEPPSIWHSVSLLIDSYQTTVTLRALPAEQLITKLFERFGITAKPSHPGLVTSRLIAQMGGIQGCRVFKIEGVRRLIAKYSPDQAFTRSNANQIIGNFDQSTGRPRFEAFEDLFFAPRSHPQKSKPQDAFDFLLERGVFRVGLELKCPHCELASWQPLDDVKTKVECSYCGTPFDVTRQLRDRDWAYRRSGLFGRDDHQRGGIPVAVTLQQLDTTLHSDRVLYTTSLDLKPSAGSAIEPCETDFVVLVAGHSHNRPDLPQVLIGECKAAGGTITAADAQHLAKVADALPYRRLNVFLVFGKTGKFSDEEVNAIAQAQDKWRSRIILLSQDELEPYFIYERHPKEPRLDRTGVEDLANSTTYLFPALRPKGFAELEAADAARRAAAKKNVANAPIATPEGEPRER